MFWQYKQAIIRPYKKIQHVIHNMHVESRQSSRHPPTQEFKDENIKLQHNFLCAHF